MSDIAKPITRAFTAALLLGLTVPALADSIRIGNRLIQPGDSEAHVLRVAGEPDRIVVLETASGGATGGRWTWYEVEDPYHDRSLVIRMRRGKVSTIQSEVHR